MSDRKTEYTRMVHSVRLTRATLSQAIAYQRKGYTLSEIARKLGLSRKPVVQALYYDMAAK